MSDFVEFERQFEPSSPPPRPIGVADADARGWWLLVLAGVALLVVGVWMLTNLFDSVVILALLVGASLIVGGVVLAWPEATIVVLAVVLGIRAVGTGLLAIGMGWQLHRLAA